MEQVFLNMLERGELTLSALVAIFLIWFFRVFWPNHVKRQKEKLVMEQMLREKELQMEERLKTKEIEARINSDQILVKHLDVLVSEMTEMKEAFSQELQGVRATFNDFLQNILSQFMEDRRDLIDTQVFKNKDRR